MFSKINYVEIKDYISAPKVPTTIGYSILQKIRGMNTTLANKFIPEKIIYYHAAPIHWGKCLSDLSILESQELNIADSYKALNIAHEYRDFAFILLNSSLFFFYWIVFSDCYNLTKKYFQINIPTSIDANKCKVLAEVQNDLSPGMCMLSFILSRLLSSRHPSTEPCSKLHYFITFLGKNPGSILAAVATSAVKGNGLVHW